MTFQVSYMVMCGPRSRLKNCSLISITILKCIERRLLIGILRFIRKIIGFLIATKRKCTNIAIYSWNFSHKHLLKLNSQLLIYVHEKKFAKRKKITKATFSVKTMKKFCFFLLINQLHEKFVKSWLYSSNTVQCSHFHRKTMTNEKEKYLNAMKA